MIDRIVVLMLGLVLACSAAAAETLQHRSLRIGGNENISEPVAGRLVVIGGNVTVNAPVAGSARLVGGKVTIGSNSVISGDTKAAAGDVTMDGTVNGNFKAAAGMVRINGTVTGNASVASGRLELGPEARIQGKLKFRGDDLRQDPAAVVTGGIEHEVPNVSWHEHMHGYPFLHGWFWTAGLMVLAAIIAVALPGVSSRLALELRERPGTTLLVGLVAFTAIPIAGLLLMLTIVGIPIALLALMAYGVMLLVGYVWLAVVVGGLLLDRVKPEVAALTGWRVGAAVLAMLVIALIARLPYVGGLTHFVAIVLGIGMIAAAAFRRPRPPEAVAP